MTVELVSPDQYCADLIENLNQISCIVETAGDIDACLNQLIQAIRNIFIFDNVVLYLVQEDKLLEPRYARAIGRGRSSETDLAWGETIANESLTKNEIIIKRDIDGDYTINRMNLRYFIGLPLSSNNIRLGSLVFVRYGGPPYQSEQIQLIKQVATHFIYFLSKLNTNQKINKLEHELRLKRLQDDFVATISHELRTPLGFIKGYTTTLLREDTKWDNVTRREFLIIIDEETDRLCELIDNLLDSSRLQSGTLRMEFQQMKLGMIVKDVCSRAQSFGENQEIELEIDNPDLQVQVDPTRISQVIENLLSNARKYAPGSKVKIALYKEKNHAHISVIDNGPGIDPDHLDHIFNRFYRVPNNTSSVRGTGLGLFICRRIIDAHDGEIYAESTLGEGSTFHIRLHIDQTNDQKTEQISVYGGEECPPKFL